MDHTNISYNVNPFEEKNQDEKAESSSVEEGLYTTGRGAEEPVFADISDNLNQPELQFSLVNPPLYNRQ